MPKQTPNFKTLNKLPSWCNMWGGIDRSACIEVRVSELRRIARCVEIIPRIRARATTLRDAFPYHVVSPLPTQRRAPFPTPVPKGIERLATGVITITAEQLHALNYARPARRLAGDHRTKRANVMRPRLIEQPPQLEPLSESSPRTIVNPNAGPDRNKITGLHPDWSQPIRIEIWRYPDRIQPAYFITCPGETMHRGERRERGVRKKGLNRPDQKSLSAHSAFSAVNPLAPLSTRPPGREKPSTRKCPQRCLKLLLIQCTPQEAADARAAQKWIRSRFRRNARSRLRLSTPERAFIAKLITRYGPIFEPRILLCPRCVGTHQFFGDARFSGHASGSSGGSGGVRYGNNPETSKQSWRRRNNKPDSTSLAARMNQRIAYGKRRGRAYLQIERAFREHRRAMEQLWRNTGGLFGARMPRGWREPHLTVLDLSPAELATLTPEQFAALVQLELAGHITPKTAEQIVEKHVTVRQANSRRTGGRWRKR